MGVVYRPNDAKVRNLKTKDYLGKARLVAASDRANAFTGFAGSEIKNAGKASVKDDRPSDNISFAATNLVKPGLQSRMPVPPGGGGGGGGGANFPPTPPPENDKPAPMSRGASVRNGPKPMPLRVNTDPVRNNSYTRASPQEERRGPSRAPSRAASVATRSPPNRGYSQRDTRSRAPRDDDGYPDDVYDMYDGGGGGDPRSSTSTRRRNNNRYDEEPEASDYDSFDEGDFEMIPQRRPTNSMSGSSRGGSRRPDIRKIRIKVHSEDVRYIMVGAAVEFADLQDRIREKFGLRRRFKIRVRDEDSSNPSDMITMGDQDDLDIAMMSAKSLARKQKQDVGKMEVSFDQNARNTIQHANLTMTDLDSRDLDVSYLKFFFGYFYPLRYPAATTTSTQRSNDAQKSRLVLLSFGRDILLAFHHPVYSLFIFCFLGIHPVLHFGHGCALSLVL